MAIMQRRYIIEKRNNSKRHSFNGDMPNIDEVYGELIDKKEEADEKREDAYFDNINDWNNALMDLDFDNKPSDEWIKRAMKSFTGGDFGKDLDGGCSTEGAKRLYAKMKKRQEKRQKEKEEDKASGLKSRMYDKKRFEKANAFEGYTRLKSNRVFLSEEDVLRRLPAKYKVDGNKLCVRDASNTNYIIECKYNPIYNSIDTKVVNKLNLGTIQEEFDKINRLAEYNSKDTNKKHRKDVEDEALYECLNIIRSKMDK